MRRKLIRQGHGTLTITIPSKWAKQFNLSAGEEIDLNERDNGIFISAEKKDEILKTTVDITGLDIPAIWKYFMAVYREGYDEVKIIFDPNQTYDHPYKFFTSHSIDKKYGKKSEKHTPSETIQEITNRFIGFEVIEHHKDHCIIKEVTEPSPKEFDSSLRRVFFLLQQMGEEIIESITTNKTEVIKHTHDIDINVDKFHDYCIRVLNKTGFKEGKKKALVFSTLYILELIGDEYKSIANHLIIDMKGKKPNSLLHLAELVVKQFNEFYNLFYNFTKEKVVDMSQRDIEIHLYLPKFYKKTLGNKSAPTNDELEICNHFRRISKYINAVMELRTEMEY